MMRVEEAARVLGARALGSDVEFLAVTTDTRSIKAGDLFVALKGERFDGHTFVAQAAAAGAAAAMVAASPAPTLPARFPLIVVDDTLDALGRLAAHWRQRFDIPVVALTGSSGKTTVKEMLAAILRKAVPVEPAGADDTVLATQGNLNNHIGVPLTLLRLRGTHRYAVVEMGMNHAGEIAYISRLAQPDVALINNAGVAHIENLGSEEAIARAKGEIFCGLKPGGTAVINADERHASLWREMAAGHQQLDFGIDAAAAVTATYRLRELDSEIVLRTSDAEIRARVPAPGLHNVRNALAASAAALALDVSAGAITAGLARFTGVKGRLAFRPALRGATLIDDTYNANPDSARAAISVLAQAAGTRLLVLGDMGELGAHGPALHAQIGEFARTAGVHRLFTLGTLSEQATRAFGAGARHFTRIEHLLAEIEPALVPGVTLLIKGSRFMKMERVVAAFVADTSDAAATNGGHA